MHDKGSRYQALFPILEASGIIYLLEPYTPSVLKRAIKTPKVYFRDTGLACLNLPGYT